MLKKLLIFIPLLLLFIAGGLWGYFSFNYPKTSPFLSVQFFWQNLLHPREKLNKRVMGFLPYWRITDSDTIKPEQLSEINYFSITTGADGHLVKMTDGKTDPGWAGLQNQTTQDLLTHARIVGTQTTITIAALTDKSIDGILESQQAQTTLINETVALVTENKLDGVNIDFEYTGDPDVKDKPAFTQFSKTLASQLKQTNPHAILSVSLMPFTMREKNIYDFTKLSTIYNYFIGMSYDYYGENAEIAGPIAPMTGFKEKKFFFDVTTMYQDFVKFLPRNKIIVGVPYYGWDWSVENGSQIQSKTLSSDDPNAYAAVISYARAREDKDFKPNQCFWDDYAEEPWCWYTSNGVDHQVWFENNKSLGIKFNLTKEQQFAGIGIWVLTYDKSYPDLANMILTTFGEK